MIQVTKLYRLQQVDSQLDQFLTRLHEIEVALQEDTAYRRAKDRTAEAKQALEVAQKALKRAEELTLSQRLKIEQSEANLYSGSIRNPKELQDLQNEVAALKRYLSVLEDKQIESMILVEERESGYTSQQTNLDAIQAKMIEQNAKLSGEKTKLLQEVDRLTLEKQAALSSIPSETLDLYEKLRREKGRIAVAKVSSSNNCSACGSTISSSHLQVARSPHQIARCEFCGRILYAI